MPVAPFVPLISSGIGLLGGVLGRRGGGGGGGNAMAQAQPAINALTNIGKTQLNQGQQAFSFGMPNLQKAGNYWSNLLSGSRAGIAGAIAPEVSALTDTYRGAQRSLERSAPGPGRDVAAAELNRQRAGQIGGLALGVRPAAAEQLGSLGQFGVTSGLQGTQGAGGTFAQLLSGQTGLGNLALSQQKFASEQNEAFGNQLSKFLVGLIQAYTNKGKSPVPLGPQ